MAKLILFNSTEVEIHPKGTDKFTYEELQWFLGGEFEIWDMKDGSYLIMLQMAYYREGPINDKATELWNKDFEGHGDIVGNVIVGDDSEID